MGIDCFAADWLPMSPNPQEPPSRGCQACLHFFNPAKGLNPDCGILLKIHMPMRCASYTIRCSAAQAKTVCRRVRSPPTDEFKPRLLNLLLWHLLFKKTMRHDAMDIFYRGYPLSKTVSRDCLVGSNLHRCSFAMCLSRIPNDGEASDLISSFLCWRAWNTIHRIASRSCG